jgi:hypothetical protein
MAAACHHLAGYINAIEDEEPRTLDPDKESRSALDSIQRHGVAGRAAPGPE